MDSDGKFFYTNAMEVAVSVYDFTFKFIRQGAAPPKPGATQAAVLRLDEMAVSMSPAHAKAMLSGIFKAVLDYEKQFGHIALEKETEQQFAQTFGSILKK